MQLAGWQGEQGGINGWALRWANVSDNDKIAFERRVRQVDLEAEHEQHEQHEQQQLHSLVPLSQPSPTGKIFGQLNTH
jgi:hypothetical protein